MQLMLAGKKITCLALSFGVAITLSAGNTWADSNFMDNVNKRQEEQEKKRREDFNEWNTQFQAQQQQNEIEDLRGKVAHQQEDFDRKLECISKGKTFRECS